MPGTLIRLNPNLSPQDYYETNKEQLGTVPDGTGLQILFNIDGELYVVAGPRQSKIISVNGGAIENKQLPFVTQLAEELNEETFGMMQLVVDPENGDYQLLLKDGSMHALSIQNQHTFLMYKTGKYAYVTFTAVCSTLTLQALQNIAQTMSPTAKFWNKIGNYLFQQTLKAPKDDPFTTYWESLIEERNKLIAELLEEYNELMDSGKQLLIDPNTVFNRNTIEDSLQELQNITNYNALTRMMRHTVGRYSERSEYQVFRASELSRAAQSTCIDKEVRDVTHKVVAQGIFNDEAVATVMPALIRSLSRVSATGVLKFGNFAQTTAPAPVPGEKAINMQATASHTETSSFNSSSFK